MLDQYFPRAGLQVGAQLVELAEGQVLPAVGVDRESFWAGVSALLHQLAPRDREL